MIGLDLWDSIKDKLDPEFARVAEKVLATTAEEGLVLRPYSGMRSPLEQAILWSQSRTPLECQLISRKLSDEGATYLAKVIARAQQINTPGRWATNSLPGQSWHNYGLALDVHVVSEDGRAVWGPKHIAYARFAEIARDHGLFPGYDLARQDVVHVQAISANVRTIKGPWAVIDKELERRFPRDAG